MNRRNLTVVRAAAVAVAAVLALAAAPRADAEQSGGAEIVYSDLYLRLIAAYPSGWVMDACGAVLEVTAQSGVCTDTLQLAYFYPDGTFGPLPWYADASSPTGWSIAPDPCTGLTDDDNALWAAYVDWVNGYSETGPDLTDEQIDRYDACWGWGF